jgi:hypothetical protein
MRIVFPIVVRLAGSGSPMQIGSLVAIPPAPHRPDSLAIGGGKVQSVNRATNVQNYRPVSYKYRSSFGIHGKSEIFLNWLK